MLAVVVKKFRDKTTNKIVMPGMKIEVTPERLAEINATALGVFAAAMPDSPVSPAPKKKKHAKGVAK